jgi:hypothetical protein
MDPLKQEPDSTVASSNGALHLHTLWAEVFIASDPVISKTATFARSAVPAGAAESLGGLRRSMVVAWIPLIIEATSGVDNRKIGSIFSTSFFAGLFRQVLCEHRSGVALSGSLVHTSTRRSRKYLYSICE